jgi:hypothetical protein
MVSLSLHVAGGQPLNSNVGWLSIPNRHIICPEVHHELQDRCSGIRRRLQRLLVILAFHAISFSAIAQSRFLENWRTLEPNTVTLFSRSKYEDQFDGYGKSTFSFKHGVRSDIGREITRNNYELQYGNINWNGDSDWFTVTMVTDDRSRIKDLGVLKWSDIVEIPLLPASTELEGFNMPSKGHEGSSNVARVVGGHLYVVHSKDSDSDFYTLFRVDNLVPSDQVTISWRVVPSPEK